MPCGPFSAALSIQADLTGYAETVQRRWRVPFQMRIGVNTGSVVVARIGDNLRMDYTAQGDTTNLAARLQQAASPGAIWVGESTHRVARGAFDWRPIGSVTVKGRGAPVAAYELLGRSALRSRFEAQAQRGLTRFVGRDAELRQLLAAWQTTRNGQGRVVSVVGEAGLGKSRLLHEFKALLAREEAQCLEGSCFAYGDSISYLPFVGVIKTLFGLDGIKTEDDAKRQIADGLATLELDLAGVAPYLHNLLTYTVEDEIFPKLPPHLVRERTVTALKTVLLGMAPRQPLVLIIEDVHWIDKATEEVVGALVEALPSVPLLLVLVYRPEYLHAWVTKAYHARIDLTRLARASGAEMVRAILHKPYASRVALHQLTAEQSSAVIQGLLGTTAIPPELDRFVVERTEGNPFFIEELTVSLLESGDLVPRNGGYALRRSLDTIDLPTTVQGVLLARIDRLTDELKSVLQVMAVIGRVFSHALLALALDRASDADLDPTLLELQDLELIYPTGLAPQREYSFKHVLTQQAVYDGLLRPRRAALHERIGQSIEVLHRNRLEEQYELLAYHYSRSTNGDKAVEYLDFANRKAFRATGQNFRKSPARVSGTHAG
jgi:predicted ATPase